MSLSSSDITNDVLSESLAKLTNLDSLQLFRCTKIDDSAFQNLEKCSNIQKLCLNGIPKLEATQIAKSLYRTKFSKLSYLSLTASSNIHHGSLSTIITKYGAQLEWFGLGGISCVDVRMTYDDD